MALPPSPRQQTLTSVRLVQQDPTMLNGSHPHFLDMERHAPRKSITVTRSLEIKATFPTSNEFPPGSSVSVEGGGGAAEAPVVPIIRMSKSAGALHKTLTSDPPRMSTDDRRSVTAMARKSVAASTATTSATDKPKTSKLPQFRQSKRWERVYNPLPAGLATIETEGEKPSTARERSMDQQRAAPPFSPQQSFAPPRFLALKPSMVSLKDDLSLLSAAGLCRPLSMPTWHALKAARASRPTSLPTRWARRVASFRRKSGQAYGRSESIRSQGKEPSVRKSHTKRRLRTKQKNADLRRKANWGASKINLAVLEDPDTVVNLDNVEHMQIRDKRSASFKKFLHDPEEVKKRSLDWGNMLANPEFDNYFFSPSGNVKLFTGANRKSLDLSEIARGHEAAAEKLTDPAGVATEQGGISFAHDVAAPEAFAYQSMPVGKRSTGPSPPERTSSKIGPKMAQVAYFSRATCIPVRAGTRDTGAMAYSDLPDTSDNLESETEPQRGNLRQRMASTFSHAGRPSKTPKHVASTDTLAKIDAEMKSPRLSTFDKIKQTTAFIIPPTRKNNPTPSGVPPPGPLPDLPSTHLESSGKSDGYKDPVVVTTVSSVTSPEIIQLPHGYESLESGRSSRRSSRRSRAAALAKGLTVRPIDVDVTSVGGAIPTPTSVYSQASVDSQQSQLLKKSYIRHDLSTFRSDRINERKKLYQKDRSRERRISEEDEIRPPGSPPTEPVLPLPLRLKAQASVDDLDKFPPPPPSRASSRASTRRTQSRARSHVRQSSRASSAHRGNVYVRQREALGTSEIKILVDANPSGKFRAGAISPEPSIAGSQNGSPTKFHRGSRQNSLQDVTNIVKPAGKKASLRSLKSQGSTRVPKTVGRTLRKGSIDGVIDGEDEVSPLLGLATNSLVRVPAKSFASGAQTAQLERIVHSLEHALKKQHEEMRKQNEEMKRQDEKIKLMGTLFNKLTLDEARRRAADSGALAQRHRDSLQVNAKVIKNGVRPISHISATSTTTNATLDSMTQTSAASGDASLTDPFEYDEPQVTKRPSTAKSSKQSVLTALHRPPPVASVIPRGRLPEETSLMSGKGSKLAIDGDEEARKRLSVNHELLTTDIIDDSLSMFNRLDWVDGRYIELPRGSFDAIDGDGDTL